MHFNEKTVTGTTIKERDRSSYDHRQELRTYVDYDNVRQLETRIINPPAGVVTNFMMKFILGHGGDLSVNYDLMDLENKALFPHGWWQT